MDIALCVPGFLAALFSLPAAGAPLPSSETAFNYQGQLKQDGRPINDTCDLFFFLMDAPVDGLDLGLIPYEELPIVDGLFSVELDFGADALVGGERFLEIIVRCPAGLGMLETLSPRQRITAAPLAVQTRGILIGGDGGVAVATEAQDGIALGGEATSETGPTAGVEGKAKSREGTGVRGLAEAMQGPAKAVEGRCSSSSGTGVHGEANSESGPTKGVEGLTRSPDGIGVRGLATATQGPAKAVEGKSSSAGGTGVLGEATSGSGLTKGVEGLSRSPDGIGVRGLTTATEGPAKAVSGESASSSGTGVHGLVTALTGQTVGVLGEAESEDGTGVVGDAKRVTGSGTGVLGKSFAPAGHGVLGKSFAPVGQTRGVKGEATSTSGTGVHGLVTAQTGQTIGVLGESESEEGSGVVGDAKRVTGSGTGVLGKSFAPAGHGVLGKSFAPVGQTRGVKGEVASTSGTGVYGEATAASGVTSGVTGESESGDGTGVLGKATKTTGVTKGVKGEAASTQGTGVFGAATAVTGATIGVTGEVDSNAGTGILGKAKAAAGVTKGLKGEATSTSGTGVHGLVTAAMGVTIGVDGETASNAGLAVRGRATAASGVTYGVRGEAVSPAGFGGYFVGRGYFSNRLGVGTETPQQQLEVAGTQAIARLSTSSNANGSLLELSNTGTQTTLGAINFLNSAGSTSGQLAYLGTANAMTLRTNGSERMRIDSAGNVGVGAAAPGAKLHVVGNRVRLENAGKMIEMRADGGAVDLQSTTNDLFISSEGAGGSNRVFINPFPQHGNVGIGTTTPTEKLSVSGNICATGNLFQCSDGRYKQHEQVIDGSLDKVSRMRGVYYNWNRAAHADKGFSDHRQVGLIAQEVCDVLPEVVSQSSDGMYVIDYGRVVPLLVEAVKELRISVQDKDAKLAADQQKLATLELRVERLEAAFSNARMGQAENQP